MIALRIAVFGEDEGWIGGLVGFRQVRQRAGGEFRGTTCPFRLRARRKENVCGRGFAWASGQNRDARGGVNSKTIGLVGITHNGLVVCDFATELGGRFSGRYDASKDCLSWRRLFGLERRSPGSFPLNRRK